jgi:hypothetical protein
MLSWRGGASLIREETNYTVFVSLISRLPVLLSFVDSWCSTCILLVFLSKRLIKYQLYCLVPSNSCHGPSPCPNTFFAKSSKSGADHQNSRSRTQCAPYSDAAISPIFRPTIGMHCTTNDSREPFAVVQLDSRRSQSWVTIRNGAILGKHK